MKGTAEERFWSKVDKSGECWVWSAGRTNYGYGSFWLASGSVVKAHRHSWELAHGDPGELFVLHHCDNPPCVRPDHLFLGTHQDNKDDSVSKGRASGGSRKGERHAGVKLSDADVLAIRSDSRLLRLIAAQYKISVQQVSNIRLRRRWTHLENLK